MTSIAGDNRERYSDDIAAAHTLVDLGVPVFSGRLDTDGNPDRTDRRWIGWHNKSPSHLPIDRWKPGEALCAVMGVKYDVLDYDPRNGGDLSYKRLSVQLGDDGPEVFWRNATPSGGQHLYIAPLGLGTIHGFWPGLDLQGGREDGSSRGFVFLPPTVRPSKADGKLYPYRQIDPIVAINGDAGCRALRKLIEVAREEPREVPNGASGARRPLSALKASCLAAGAGEQRTALLALVQEWERKGYEPDDIIELLIPVAEAMEAYDQAHPWYPIRGRRPDDALRSLLHGERSRPIPDAVPGELDGITDAAIQAEELTRLVMPVSQIPRRLVSWFMEAYIALCEITILDGEKGQGKTSVVYDIAARASRGDEMPGGRKGLGEPCNVIIFTHEGRAAVEPRLRAAGADIDRVFVPDLPQKKKKRGAGNIQDDDPLALPGGADIIAKMIKQAGAKLAIFDPITDFLDETILTHNDASVRRALNPLGIKLNILECAGIGLRHMNKNKEGDARMRGAGSTAFQNRARVHLVAGEIEPLNVGTDSETRRFGIGMADANDIKRVGGVLTYTIVDSDVPLDEDGRMVARVEWGGYEDIALDDLTRGYDHRKSGHGGRKPMAQEAVEEVLSDMFATPGQHDAKKVKTALVDAGCSVAPSVLAKARASLGIRTARVVRRGGFGVERGVWIRD